MKGILNKLTPENFDRLLQQVLDTVQDAGVLHATITLVFENAVAQPTFAFMYAQLCDRLSKARDPLKALHTKPYQPNNPEKPSLTQALPGCPGVPLPSLSRTFHACVFPRGTGLSVYMLCSRWCARTLAYACCKRMLREGQGGQQQQHAGSPVWCSTDGQAVCAAGAA